MRNIGVLFLLLFASLLNATAQQAHINLDWDPQKNKEDLIPFSANVNSPEVMDDHTVIFRLKAPEVSKVLLTGTMFVGEEAGKQVPFTKGDDGLWTLKI